MITDAQLIKFIRTKKYYPHCRALHTLTDLKSGVVLAELLCDTLDQEYHGLFLPKIQTTNLSVDKCIANLRVIIETLHIYVAALDNSEMTSVIATFKPQNLYYRQSQIRRLFITVIFPMTDAKQSHEIKRPSQSKQITAYASTALAHSSIQTNNQFRSKPLESCNNQLSYKNSLHYIPYPNDNNISQLSEIGRNGESLLGGKQQSQIDQINNYAEIAQRVAKQGQYQFKEKQSSLQEIQLEEEQLEKLEIWINKKLKGIQSEFQFSDDVREEPDQVLGLLINSIFCGSRFSDHIIKQAQFLQGPIFIYRKVLAFLLNNPQAQRVNKQNALKILQSIDQQGTIHENDYWQLMNDLYQFEEKKSRSISSRNKKKESASKPQRSSKKGSIKKTRINTETSDQENKENVKTIINKKQSVKEKGGKQLIHKPSSKHILAQNKYQSKAKTCQSQKLFVYEDSVVHEVQKWISEELGYQYSLAKSKQKTENFLQNPLFNGSLIASIIMRLKVGRISVIKNPINQKQVRDNWQQIMKVCVLRGYQSFKQLTFTDKLDYRTYIGILGDFKKQYQRFNPVKIIPNKIESIENDCKICDPFLVHENVQGSDHQVTLDWVNSLDISFDNNIKMTSKYLSVSAITSICKKFLSLTLLRETTRKIQENNIQKILGEFRRLGLASYYPLTAKKVMDESGIQYRWMMIEDLKWIMQDKIQYCQ